MKHLPNTLSAGRIPLAVAICLACTSKQWTLAFWLFALSGSTDVIDGPLARMLRVASPTGELLDHTGDFFVLCSTMIGLTLGGIVQPETLISAGLGLVIGAFISRSGAVPASSQRTAVGVIMFVGFMLLLGLKLASLAYGWHLAYIAIVAVILVPVAILKRGRLSA